MIDDEVLEEDDGSDEWTDPEEDEAWSEEDEEWTEDEDGTEDTEEMPAYSDDYEKDCLEMGGVWYPGDGCAWPDEE